MTLDLHCHSRFSVDSRADMASYCRRARELGVDAICFTDHVDYNELYDGKPYYDPDGYWRELAAARESYPQLRLLSGMEFSEAHLFQPELAALKSRGYDMVMGSCHVWYENVFISQIIERNLISMEESYRLYWEALLAMVRAGGFQVLGHIDFPKRYYRQILHDEHKIREICRTAVEQGICLEINTSSLRKGLDEPMPGRHILDIYRQEGGKYVTIGSDAHKPEDLAAGREEAREIAEGFIEVMFVQGERVEVGGL